MVVVKKTKDNNSSDMKRILGISGGLLLGLGVLLSCQNDDWEFPDFDYTTVYFPYQYPVRTLVLGDYYFDNSGDNEGKFKIGATMGGVYENTRDITVDFVLDESLTNNLFNINTGLPIKAMPASYYTLASSQIVIPKGQTFGFVDVELSPAFFADTLAIGQHYVIPLRMVSASTDSILQGRPGTANPDPRIAGNWVLAPKDFTLFGVKYVNEFHGKYLMRGGSEVRNIATDTLVENVVYRQAYLERNPVVTVSTISLNTVRYSNVIRLGSGSPGSFEIDITFDESGNGVVENTDKYPFTVTGTSKFVKDAEEWGNEKRHVIYLDYDITEGTNIHHVADTLVFRDKAVKFEEFRPSVQ
jgi:hypothetical protein